MSLKKLFEDGRLKQHHPSKKEIQYLFMVMERDLKDAQVSGLSLDRRFATAYSAALQAGRTILAATGYRTSGIGHHITVFDALKSILEEEHHATLYYFNDCRDKRNLVDYGVSGLISEKEVMEIIFEAGRFVTFTRTWIKKNHPHLL